MTNRYADGLLEEMRCGLEDSQDAFKAFEVLCVPKVAGGESCSSCLVMRLCNRYMAELEDVRGKFR